MRLFFYFVIGAGLIWSTVPFSFKTSDSDDGWSYGAEAQYTFASPQFGSLMHNVAAKGTINSVGYSEWHKWSHPDDNNPNVEIGIWHRGPLNRYTYAVRPMLVKMHALKNGDIRTGSAELSLKTDLGSFQILPFVYESRGMEKHCYGFLSTKVNPNYYIRGHYCANPKFQPDKFKLSCILSSIKVPGAKSSRRPGDPKCTGKTLIETERSLPSARI